MDIFQSILGILVFILFAWGISENRSNLKLRIVLGGLSLQFLLAFLLIGNEFAEKIFSALNTFVTSLQKATTEGAVMVFGYLGGGAFPFNTEGSASTFILAFQALPLVLLMSALLAILYHWKVLPLLIKYLSLLLEKTTGVGGAVSIATAANVFIGMVEAPLLVRPYISRMSRSEIFILMTSGMATISGTVLVLYAYLLESSMGSALGHILTASLMSAPAAIMFALLMVPEGNEREIVSNYKFENQYSSTMDAIVQGTDAGLKLLLNIVAILIVFVALVSLINMILAAFGSYLGITVKLQDLLGYAMAPVVWLTGIPWSECLDAGKLMGIKTVLNEFLAYQELSLIGDELLCKRSKVIMTYSLCGFANFASLGIVLAGLKSMAPNRKNEFISLGFKSIISGTLSTLLTGAIASLFII